jgi:hypothetical protein
VLQQTVDELQQKIAAEHETANALREQALYVMFTCSLSYLNSNLCDFSTVEAPALVRRGVCSMI